MHLKQAQYMARYNQWMNERIYSLCAQLTDAERRSDRGAFFKSIHGTLNHLLLADKLWLGRFLGTPFPIDGLDQELYQDFNQLAVARKETDEAILAWTNSLTDQVLSGQLLYTSIVNPEPRQYDYWFAVTHFFNHQTHHRGQLSTLLNQCGKDCGVTDLIWLPEAIERNAT